MRKRHFYAGSIILLLAIFSVFVLLSCAGKKPAWGDAKTGFILKYNFPVNQTVKYKFDQVQKISQEMMGQSMEINTTSEGVMFLTGNGKDESGNFLLKAGFDSLSLMTSARGQEIKPDLKPLFGKSFDLTLSSIGEKIAFHDPDSIKINFGPMAGERPASDFFRSPLPKLPDHPVKIGDTWISEDSTTMKQAGMDIIIKNKSENRLEKIEVVDGIECFKVVSTSTGTLDGSGSQMGMSLYIEGDVSGDAIIYFSFKDGKLLSWENNTLMEGTVALTGQQNMTIPMTQESKTTIKLLK